MPEQLRMDAVVDDKATGPLRRIKEQLEAFRETEGMKSLKENMTVLREQTTEFAKAAGGASAIMGGIGAVGLGAAFSVGKLVETFRDLASNAMGMRSLAVETGMTVDAINRYESVAPRFGVAPEEMGKALGTLGEQMVDFRRHTGELYSELARQAPDLTKQLLGENPDAQVQDIFKFLEGLAPQMRRRYAELFFGDGDMAKLVEQGGDKLKETLAKIPHITTDYLNQAQAFNDSIQDFNTSLDLLEKKAGPAIFTELRQAADDFRKVFDEIAGVAGTVATALKPLTDWLDHEKGRTLPQMTGDAVSDSVDALKDAARTHAGEDGNALRSRDEVPLGFQPPKQSHGALGSSLLQLSAYTTFDNDGGSGPSFGTGSETLQKAVRLGVVQGLQDFENIERAETAGDGGRKEGSGFQRASYETGGLPPAAGGGRDGSVPDVYSALKGDASVREWMDFIRSEAAKLGIDPSIALAVANSEGLNTFTGDHGTSYGDFQLHIGGGLGDEFHKATGLDPSDPGNWRQMDQFALRHASKKGWGDFHGAARVGIGRMQGIGVGDGDATARPGQEGGAVDVANSMLGLHEVRDRAAVNSFLNSHGQHIDAARTAWCAAFVNSALSAVGIKGTGSLAAASFAKWGQSVMGQRLQKGDVIVKNHHVGLFDHYGPHGEIDMISGNHGNAVGHSTEDPRGILDVRRARPNLWDTAKATGDGHQTVTHKGKAELTIKGLPKGTGVHSKTDGLIDSVKLERASSQPDMVWGSV